MKKRRKRINTNYNAYDDGKSNDKIKKNKKKRVRMEIIMITGIP